MRARSLFITLLLMWGAVPALAQMPDNEVRYEARDSIRYDLRTQTVYLFGAATVQYEDIQLSADRIVFSFQNEEAQAFGAPDSTGAVVGKPRFTQGGHTIDADSIRYNFNSKAGLIREVRTQEQEAWVHARLSKRHPNGEVHSLGGMLTTCDRPYPHYHFKVSRMIVIPDDKIVAGAAYMKLGRKIPLPLAVPFGLFPNKKGRSSGVLIPVWGSSDQQGLFLLNGGYYLPISDHLDLQLTGDIYSRGSWALRSLARYKTRYRYSGDLDLSRSALLTSDPEFPDFSRQDNFFIRWNHQADPKASLTDRFTASVNLGTSQNFTNNFNSSAYDYLSNTFQSNIAWTHLWPGRPFSLSTNLRHSQNTLNRTFDITVPSVTFNMTRVLPFQSRKPGAKRHWSKGLYDQVGVSYSMNFDNRLSTTEERLYWANLPTLARELRNGIRHTAALTSSYKTRFFSLNPEVRYTDRWYFATLERSWDPETNTAVRDTVRGFARAGEMNMSATLTSKLYGMYTFQGEGLKAIRHVITPTVSFNYRPDMGTELTGPYGVDGAQVTYSPFDMGIYGKPSPGASGALNLGLIQNIEAKVRDRSKSANPDSVSHKKIKLIEYLGVTASHDLLRDSLRWSPINGAARTQLFNLINLNLVSIWDPYAVDSLGRRIDRSEQRTTGRLARMSYTNVALGFDLKSKRYGQPAGSASSTDRQVVTDSDPAKGAPNNFNLPWRLGVNYSYDVNRQYAGGTHTDVERQSVIFNGDLTVLKYWKLGFSSGYDLTNQDWTPTSLNLYWDLHCWEFNFNIIPIGVRKSFMFRINVKASILRDLKFEQRRPYGESRDLLY
jgi:hypothetical protein